jgi:PAS domain S-box-containing protein
VIIYAIDCTLEQIHPLPPKKCSLRNFCIIIKATPLLKRCSTMRSLVFPKKSRVTPVMRTLILSLTAAVLFVAIILLGVVLVQQYQDRPVDDSLAPLPAFGMQQTIQQLLLIAGAIGLMLAVFIGMVFLSIRRYALERQQLEDALTQLNDDLEQRITQRTAELTQANQALLAQMNELQLAEESLEKERAMLRAITDNLPDLIWVKDAQSRFVFSSKASTRFSGMATSENLIGKTDFDLHPPQLAAKYFEDEQNFLRSDLEVVDVEDELVDWQGKRQWVRTTRVILRDGDGERIGMVGISRDITQQRLDEQTLRRLNDDLWRERAQLRAILDAMTEGVIFDQKLQTVYINKALTRITGYNADEWGGYLELLKPDSVPEDEFVQWRSMIFDAIIQTGVWRGETRLQCKDGRLFDAHLSVSQVNDSEGNIIGAVTIIRDISDEKTLSQQKARFVANASHELRNPITNLKVRLYLLQNQPQNSSEHLQIMTQVTQRMGRLVEDLLDLSRFENGQIPIDRAVIALQPLLEEVVVLQTPEAEAQQVALNLDLCQRPLSIFADEDRIVQVMTNLVANAIHYTPPGGKIVVRCKPEMDEQRQEWVIIQVEDTGVGIPPEMIDNVFQPFFRADSNHKIPGVGLGLTISKEIIEAHGGQISVESQLGKGSIFTIKLALSS